MATYSLLLSGTGFLSILLGMQAGMESLGSKLHGEFVFSLGQHLKDCLTTKSEGVLMKEGSLDCTSSVLLPPG